MSERIAAIDVGSNTVHMLVGEPEGDAVREVYRQVEMPRLGAAVTATGRIGEAKIREVAGLLKSMVEAAPAHGAKVVLLAATEATREAADRDEAVRAFSEAAGVPCHLIPGEVEARLSFRGAVTVAPDGHSTYLVCDIGGGSTEFAMGTRHEIGAHVSLPIGSGSATDRWLKSDPPTDEERRACLDWLVTSLRAAPQGHPDHVIATGGTAASLPVLLGRDRETHLDADDLAHCRAILGRHPSAEIAKKYGLEPERARVLAGGVEIVDAVRTLSGVDRIRVTIQGLRTGMILAYAAVNDRWVEG
jgi:exopolyphosphatase/guanosine-5'-triphosphate,3'-diphosphate pyrophosphatase